MPPVSDASVNSERLAQAAERWGTPAYVTDVDRVAGNLAAWRAAFPEALVAYAVKANPDPALLRRLVRDGAGCEVVNAVELTLAQRAGCPPERLVMDGVGKTDDDLRAAIAAGALINVESLDELGALLGLAGAGRIGIRLNPGLDPGTHPHLATGAPEAKFGIGLADLPTALDLLRAAGAQLRALGAHIGSDVASREPFVALTRLLADAARDLPGVAIDVGGGMPDAEASRLAALASAVRGALGSRPLIVEPGRSLVADAGWLVTRVVRVQPRDRVVHLVADAGMSELLRPALYGAEHPVVLLADGARLALDGRTLVLSGPVCEAGDVLVRDLGRHLTPDQLARAGRGALLAIEHAGAYGAAMASNYNGRLRPAEVVIEGGEPRLSRRRESVEDLVRRDADA
jgi:diaminopimelate decarboxylase